MKVGKWEWFPNWGLWVKRDGDSIELRLKPPRIQWVPGWFVL